MEISFLLKGLIIGFSIAAPVGPIGILCIRRTLTQGRLAGFISGVGAATADAIYGCLAGLGLTFVSSLLIEQQLWLRLIGGIFLCYLGIKTLISRPLEAAAKVTGNSLISAYVSTFFLTLTNPLTLLSFVAVFAGLGVAQGSVNYLLAIILVCGVFTGSALWWLLLCVCIGLVGTKLTAQSLQWVNRISGIIITIFGVAALLNLKT